MRCPQCGNETDEDGALVVLFGAVVGASVTATIALVGLFAMVVYVMGSAR